VLSTTVDLKPSMQQTSPSKKSNNEDQQNGPQLNPEMTARMLYVAIKWVKTLPSFNMLSLSDQV
jgi:hypothetical protein